MSTTEAHKLQSLPADVLRCGMQSAYRIHKIVTMVGDYNFPSPYCSLHCFLIFFSGPSFNWPSELGYGHGFKKATDKPAKSRPSVVFYYCVFIIFFFLFLVIVYLVYDLHDK